MGLFDKILKRKEDENVPPPVEEPKPLEELPSLGPEDLKPMDELKPPIEPTLVPPKQPLKEEKPSLQDDTLKAKLDLILTKIGNLKEQNENIMERLKKLERIVAEMRGIRYY